MDSTITSTALVQALRQPGDQAAWAEFCARFEPVLAAVMQRASLPPEDARDAVQETLLACVTGLRENRYDSQRGRLRHWVQGVALNKVHEARRRRRREIQPNDPTDGTGLLERVPDEQTLSHVFEEEWQARVLTECLRLVRAQVEDATYEAFRLYALEQWPAERVAERLGIARDAVYVCKSRVLAHLRKLQQQWTDAG